MKKLLLYVIVATTLGMGVATATPPDEDDYDESVRLPVRRLHPEREFDKMMKKMHQEKSAKQQKEAEKKARKQAKKDAKKAAKAGERKVVATRQQPASTTDKSLMRELLSKDYSIKKYELIYEEPKPITWKDDPIATNVKELLNNIKKIEQRAATLYVSQEVTMASDANEVYFCFEGNDTRANGGLHLRVSYFADDPLHYHDIVFTIDGFDYVFTPSHPMRGKQGSRMYWERSDDVMASEHKDLVYALSHCHWARMSLRGADGMNHVKMLTKVQLKAFTHTFELYRAMGGTL